MKPRYLFVWFVALAALALAAFSAPTRQASASNSYFFSFSQSVRPWSASTNLPNRQKLVSLERVVGENGCPDMLFAAYARLTGHSDLPPEMRIYPVGTWAAVPVWAPGLNQINVTYNAKDAGKCDGCTPITYIGVTPPTDVSQFHIDQSGQGLRSDWRTYSYSATVSTPGEMYVAIGWMGTDASMGLDCVTINAQSIAAAK